MVCDKLQMVRRSLINVMRRARIEDNIQADVEVVIVYRASVLFGQRPGSKKDDTWMIFQILLTRVQKCLDGRW